MEAALTLTEDRIPEFTFASFVVGPESELAFKAAQAVAEGRGQAWNPLFLHGSPAVGKSHLLRAIAGAAEARGRSVAYLSAERFTNEMIDSISEAKTRSFRKRYRELDFLLIDNLSFLESKERTQEELFNTFEDLQLRGAQIALAGNQAARNLKLSEELRSRCSGGLIVEILAPGVATRLQILLNKASSLGSPIPEEVAHLILERLPSDDLRVQEGALKWVLAFCSLHGRPMTCETAVQAWVSARDYR